MADIDVSGDSGHKKGPGVKKAKKLSTRVDMTPMVDLGFLLITFFIFTTTMSTPTTMPLKMPKKVNNEEDQLQLKESNVLSILYGREGAKGEARTVYYYMGQLKDDGSNLQTTTMKDLRKIIMDKRNEVISRHVHDEKECAKVKKIAEEDGDPEWEKACLDREFVVVIKPTKDARYATTIDLIDEMAITGVDGNFALVDIAESERQLVEKIEQTNGLR